MRRIIVVAAVVLGSCAVATDDRARVTDRKDVPFGLLDRNAPPLVPTTLSGPESEDAQLWFVGDGRLVPVATRLARPVTPAAAVAALASPPANTTATLRTALTDPAIVRSIEVAAGVARVDLARTITELGEADQLLAVAQIVYTVTARPGVGQVTFGVEGAPVDVPRSDGSLTSQPVSRDDYASLVG